MVGDRALDISFPQLVVCARNPKPAASNYCYGIGDSHMHSMGSICPNSGGDSDQRTGNRLYSGGFHRRPTPRRRSDSNHRNGQSVGRLHHMGADVLSSAADHPDGFEHGRGS